MRRNAAGSAPLGALLERGDLLGEIVTADHVDALPGGAGEGPRGRRGLVDAVEGDEDGEDQPDHDTWLPFRDGSVVITSDPAGARNSSVHPAFVENSPPVGPCLSPPCAFFSALARLSMVSDCRMTRPLPSRVASDRPSPPNTAFMIP